MKILIVCQHFDPEQFRINDIAYELYNRGHKVTVLTGLPNYPKGRVYGGYTWFKKRNETINGVKVIRTFIIGRGNNLFMMGMNYLSFALFGSIKALSMKDRFDVIYVYQLSPVTMVIPGIIIKKLHKTPLIIHCLDQWPISVTTGPIRENSLLYRFLFFLSRQVYISASIITVSSKSFTEYFTDILKITNIEIKYWPSYAEEIYSDIGNIDNGMFDLLFAGNIGPAQSVETIIEAANFLKDQKKIMFHIVGDGLNKKQCESLAEEYKLDNIKFYGYYPVIEMKQFYEMADAFLVTMVNNEVVNQTLPAKIQSYMLAGKPIIGAVSGEVKQVIEESRSGVCCDSLDYKALAKNIVDFVKDVDGKCDLGKNGKEYYQINFSKVKLMDDLVVYLEDARKLK